jgi:hypothetical protein
VSDSCFCRLGSGAPTITGWFIYIIMSPAADHTCPQT